MALSLYVETARWRAHQQSVLEAFPGLVPVAKGNGYGFGNRRLAEEATRLGAPMLAVGTAYEAAEAVEYFGGDVLVLTPYRIGEDPVPLPRRVIRTVGSVSGVRALVGCRVVVECMTSMRRHGINEPDVPKLVTALDDVRLEGFALHLPLDRPDGYDPVQECADWVDRLTAAGLPIPAVYVSHLSADEIGRLRGMYPGLAFRPRIGTRLWLGDHDALDCRGTVLDVTPVAKGDRYGYRQLKAPVDGHLVVVAGGTAHGVGLEAPKYMHGVTPRAKNLARAGLATVNRTPSPFSWNGRKAAFAEPPHMQVSILFVPGETAPPTVGEELRATLRHTTTHFDRTVDR
ncbi:alanine racemase [Streptacidiphilus griseoplanus]|uniref:alanine racemase n=1 Tax=Peterkaempfera griseoplana TaxID=66896 RepID=UPI0006E37D28|nr:alanine racemase [Peterkaempfera griseoplana]